MRNSCFLLLPMSAAVLSIGLSWHQPEQAGTDAIHRLGSRMAAEALRASGGSACDRNGRCDRATGCIAPVRPPGPILETHPQDERHRLHVRDLQGFQLCRQLVLSAAFRKKTDMTLVSADGAAPEQRAFAAIAQRWNGDVLWAPASASNDIITRFGDEARAVFGPIPDGDCTGGDAKSIPLEIEGNIVDLKPNPGKVGKPLEFEHRGADGKIVKWTESIAQCDKPSLAGNATYCGMNSRLNRIVKGSVEWLVFCRKSTPHLGIEPEPYWQKSNPKFARLGMIGFNSLTGEIVFFDGRKDRAEFDWTQTFVPPGGRSYSDREGRAEAEALYDPTFQIECSACHDNKNPYVVNPHIGQARVGYRAGAQGREASAFSLGDYLPKTPRNEQRPFRVVGSGYTSTYGTSLRQAKTVRDPMGNCTECHTLTTQITGRRFASDATARAPFIADPSWAQLLEMRAERLELTAVNTHRTDWALRSGPGKIHPWMLPAKGNDLSAVAPEISSTDWEKLSNCLWGAGGTECGYRPLYTPCPPPGSPQGDGSEPLNSSVTELAPPAGEVNADRLLRLSWRYSNSYGNVPQRDDVRFNIAVKAVAIPSSGRAPLAGDYPDLDEAKGENFTAIDGEIGTSGSALLIRNASYFGHAKFTEPTPSTDLREFRIDLPAQCGRRYLVRLLPKRLCFDQSDTAYAEKGQLLYADIRCG
ncbi:hypothetical protein LJR235_004179 [Pararhizobium sp. LjRoot235]|uniref:hypothetical protein n=1 Tax=Pararhizobium sp. LjRoot235 TaxID=3342291 RepID=UPI003ED0EF39